MTCSGTRKKILISAFACSPNRGSELGMGWNWVSRLARHHDVWLITEQDSLSAMENYFSAHPEERVLKNIIGIPHIRNRRLESIWSHFYYLSYRNWQRQAFLVARELHDKIGFDLVHQLNMIGYREPGYLWKLPVPFVWGPIGGHAQMPWRYMGFLGARGACYYGLRNLLNWIQMRSSIRVRRAISGAAALISATPDDNRAIRRIHGRSSIQISEVGTSPAEFVDSLPCHDADSSVLQLVWVGILQERKALPIALHALKDAAGRSRLPIKLHVVGSGRCEKRWKVLAEQLGIGELCIWHGELPHQASLEIISGADALVLTSLQDATSTVLLEAISNGVPVICHDMCGFSSIIDSSCGVVVPACSPKKSIDGFSKAMSLLGSDGELLARLKKGARERALQESWENRVDSMLQVYESVPAN